MVDKIWFPAVFEQGPDSIGVSFPDLPGVVTAGKNIADALAMAHEALLLHLEGMIEDGDEFPEPSHPSLVKLGKGEFVSVIDVPHPAKLVRVNITTTAADLARIDALANKAGMNRSAWMVLAAAGEQEHPDQDDQVQRVKDAYVAERRSKRYARNGQLVEKTSKKAVKRNIRMD